MTTTSSNEQDHLLPTKAATSSDLVIATSIGGTSPEPTVHALFHSNDKTDAVTFLRQVFALLVFQYSTVLVVASPFALIEDFKDLVHPHHHALLLIAVGGMVASILLALTMGAVYPWSRIVIVTLTISVAVELGLTFSEKSWGDCGLLAVTQATVSFAMILALLQFTVPIQHTMSTAAIFCIFIGGIWSVVLHEAGLRWGVAVAVSLGGFVFTMLNLSSVFNLCKLVAPGEYVFTTLFILFPQAVLCLSISKKRRVHSE